MCLRLREGEKERERERERERAREREKERERERENTHCILDTLIIEQYNPGEREEEHIIYNKHLPTREQSFIHPTRAVDNALTLFRVWPIKNVGAIFGHASAAAQRITCLVAGFKRLFCSICE